MQLPLITIGKTSPINLSQYTIENSSGTRLIVSNIGAAIVSFFVKDKYGNLSDIVLGYQTPEDYLTDQFYLGTVVGRYANRIAGDTVFVNNHPFKLATKPGGYHLHGGNEGFNKKLFFASPFKSKNKSGIIFEYISPDMEEGFPGEFKLSVKYTLHNDDTLTLEYKGISNKTTLVNLTQHSYFNLSGNLATTIDDHKIKILSNYYLPVNKMQVPTGQIATVFNTPFDFRIFKNIAQDIFEDNEQLKLSNGYDHSFVLDKEAGKKLKRAVIVKEPVSGRRMDVYTTEPAVHFYTGNFLDNVIGKNGIKYSKRSGFCLETQHFPDAPNHPNFPSTILQAGQLFFSKTIFKLSIC